MQYDKNKSYYCYDNKHNPFSLDNNVILANNNFKSKLKKTGTGKARIKKR